MCGLSADVGRRVLNLVLKLGLQFGVDLWLLDLLGVLLARECPQLLRLKLLINFILDQFVFFCHYVREVRLQVAYF